MDPVNAQAIFEVRSFARSWDNSRYEKKLETFAGYAVQGHPRSLILVPIESAYVTSYADIFNVKIHMVQSYEALDRLRVRLNMYLVG